MESASKLDIMKNVYRKLSGMMVAFDIPEYNPDMPPEMVEKYIGGDYNDAIRGMGVNLDNVDKGSTMELAIETKTIIFALRRFKATTAVWFKFSTAVDGKTVDKTKVFEAIDATIKDYENEYKDYILAATGKSLGSRWDRKAYNHVKRGGPRC